MKTNVLRIELADVKLLISNKQDAMKLKTYRIFSRARYFRLMLRNETQILYKAYDTLKNEKQLKRFTYVSNYKRNKKKINYIEILNILIKILFVKLICMCITHFRSF